MASVVALADDDAVGAEVDKEGVEGAQSGGVGQDVAPEEGGEDGFEAGRVGC